MTRPLGGCEPQHKIDKANAIHAEVTKELLERFGADAWKICPSARRWLDKADDDIARYPAVGSANGALRAARTARLRADACLAGVSGRDER